MRAEGRRSKDLLSRSREGEKNGNENNAPALKRPSPKDFSLLPRLLTEPVI